MWSENTIGSEGGFNLAAVDVNNDNALDVVVPHGHAFVSWFENNGATLYTESSCSQLSVTYCSFA